LLLHFGGGAGGFLIFLLVRPPPIRRVVGGKKTRLEVGPRNTSAIGSYAPDPKSLGLFLSRRVPLLGRCNNEEW
jgi:hypothetical protein